MARKLFPRLRGKYGGAGMGASYVHIRVRSRSVNPTRPHRLAALPRSTSPVSRGKSAVTGAVARCIFNAPYLPLYPLIPAQAGIQGGWFRWAWPWIPTFVGMSGTMSWLSRRWENWDPRDGAEDDLRGALGGCRTCDSKDWAWLLQGN